MSDYPSFLLGWILERIENGKFWRKICLKNLRVRGKLSVSEGSGGLRGSWFNLPLWFKKNLTDPAVLTKSGSNVHWGSNNLKNARPHSEMDKWQQSQGRSTTSILPFFPEASWIWNLYIFPIG
jgi:hypothetical protein